MRRKLVNSRSHPWNVLDRQVRLEQCRKAVYKVINGEPSSVEAASCRTRHLPLCEVCRYVGRLAMSAKKVTKGLYGPETTVLLCREYKPKKPKQYQLNAVLKPVELSDKALASTFLKQHGMCLCHGKPLDPLFCTPYQVFPNA